MIEIKDRDKYCNQFLDTFHFQLNGCAEVMPISQGKELKTLIGLNIFKFEEKMREKGYKQRTKELEKENDKLKDKIKELETKIKFLQYLIKR